LCRLQVEAGNRLLPDRAVVVSSSHDAILEAYRDWLNELLFEKKGEGDHIAWLGEGRWLITSVEGPDTLLVELRRAEVKPVV